MIPNCSGRVSVRGVLVVWAVEVEIVHRACPLPLFLSFVTGSRTTAFKKTLFWYDHIDDKPSMVRTSTV